VIIDDCCCCRRSEEALRDFDFVPGPAHPEKDLCENVAQRKPSLIEEMKLNFVVVRHTSGTRWREPNLAKSRP
jgi:hypothetical protein